MISSFLTLDSIWHKYFISLTRFNLSSHCLGMQELIPGCCSSLVSLPKDLETFISVIAKEKHCFFFVLFFFFFLSTHRTLHCYSQYSLNISSHQMCGGGSHSKQFNISWVSSVLVAQSCLTLCDPMYCSPSGSVVHGDSPGKNTGVGCHSLLQGIFPTQVSRIVGRFSQHLHMGVNVGLSHQGSP